MMVTSGEQSPAIERCYTTTSGYTCALSMTSPKSRNLEGNGSARMQVTFKSRESPVVIRSCRPPEEASYGFQEGARNDI